MPPGFLPARCILDLRTKCPDEVSDTLPGSKAEVGPVLAELKSLNPGAYARTVTVPEGPYESACPRLEP